MALMGNYLLSWRGPVTPPPEPVRRRNRLLGESIAAGSCDSDLDDHPTIFRVALLLDHEVVHTPVRRREPRFAGEGVGRSRIFGLPREQPATLLPEDRKDGYAVLVSPLRVVDNAAEPFGVLALRRAGRLRLHEPLIVLARNRDCDISRGILRGDGRSEREDGDEREKGDEDTIACLHVLGLQRDATVFGSDLLLHIWITIFEPKRQ